MWKVNRDVCLRCGGCVAVCPVSALELRESGPEENGKCIACGTCEKVCPVRAITVKK